MTEQRPIPKDPDFEARVRDSFARQPAMAHIGASLMTVEPGHVAIRLAHAAHNTQQHGFVHGGMVGMIGDSACGYAAYTLMPADASVMSVEYKINFLEPAAGDELIAHGRVRKAGRTLSVCDMEVVARTGTKEKTIASGVVTLICLQGKSDRPKA
jgi:uncharacterized protein (TIGR00369 family)